MAGVLSRRMIAVSAAGLAMVAATVAFYVAGSGPPAAAPVLGEFPIEGPLAYKVEYLGVTCGHMSLESRRATFRGRDAYHVIMTARNSDFFNKIYRVDGRIESWVDAATMSTMAYRSDITEKGDRDVRQYVVDRERNVVVAEKDGKVEEVPFEAGAALDPLAFIFRGRVLAGYPETSFSLRLLTDKGVIETVTRVLEFKGMSTFDGRRVLLGVEPQTADSEMFARKGEFSYWIDPGPQRTLYLLDFKLSFGRLVARLMGPADGDFDRRDLTREPANSN
jgi:hypothetical protein